MNKEREGMIIPGQVEWFPAEKFAGYLWGFDDSVWVSLIISKREGEGNLSRLFRSIWKSGRSVIVPEPFARMEAILRAKGFTRSLYEDGGAVIWTKKPDSAESEAA